jgi:hypothetical protein
MSDFDPYHQWLGIPETERPISKYRLLALVDFEADRDVISTAAERQTVFLRTLQAGEHEVLVAQLLNEVSQARVCLLDGKSKARYDQQLRAAQQPDPEDDPLAFTTEELAAVSSRPASRSRSRGGKPFWQEPWAIPAGAGGIVVLLLLMWLLSSGEEPKGSGQEQELQAEIALLKEKLVASGNNKGEGNAELAKKNTELSQQNAELEAQIGDRSLDSSNVEGIPFELNSSESIKDPIFTYNLQGAYDGDIGMVLDPNKEIDLGKSWILRFTLTPPESPQKRRPFIVWGDSRPGLDALVISYGEGLLSFSVTDCNNRSGKGGRLPVDLKIGAEIDIELEYSSRSNTIAITADGDREEVQLDFTPALDRESPLYIGIIQGHPGRFVGTVANFQFGNIERPAKRNSGLPAFLKQGLVAYYPFNGNAHDESGNGHHGEIKNVVLTRDRHGGEEKAFYFAGRGQHISLPPFQYGSRFSVSIWANSFTESDIQHYLSKKPGDALDSVQFYNDQRGDNHAYKAMVFSSDNLGIGRHAQHLPDTPGNWSHLVFTYDGGNTSSALRIYQHGVRADTDDFGQGRSFVSFNDLNVRSEIGSQNKGADSFHGILDDVRIYNRALSEKEVRQLYEFESGGTVAAATSDKMYLATLRPESVHSFSYYIGDNQGENIKINGKGSSHGIVVHPRIRREGANAVGLARFRIPAGYRFFAGAVAFADSSRSLYPKPITFKVISKENGQLSAAQIQRQGQSIGFCVALDGTTEIELHTLCSNPDFAYALWLDPVLLKSTGGKSLEQIANEQQARWIKKEE